MAYVLQHSDTCGAPHTPRITSGTQHASEWRTRARAAVACLLTLPRARRLCCSMVGACGRHTVELLLLLLLLIYARDARYGLCASVGCTV